MKKTLDLPTKTLDVVILRSIIYVTFLSEYMDTVGGQRGNVLRLKNQKKFEDENTNEN